jgi:hypothetical protein
VRSYLITTSGGSFDCINCLYLDRVTEKVSSGFPMEYVEAYASRAGFVLPHDGKILWTHSMRFHPMLQHVTRSRGWNIMERVTGNVGNEIELGMVIPTIKSRILQVSRKQREYEIGVCGSTTKDLRECTGVIMDIQI